MIAAQNLQVVQRILEELHAYGQAHVDEAWAEFLNRKVEEALKKMSVVSEEDEYMSLSGKTLPQIYTEVKEEEARKPVSELIERLRTPNPLLEDLMREDD